MWSKILVKLISTSASCNRTAVSPILTRFKMHSAPQTAIDVFPTQNELNEVRRNERNYEIGFAKPDDTNQILHFIEKTYFCENALSMSLHLCYRKLDKSLKFYIKDLLSHGLTVVARENSYDKQIIGLCVNHKSCKWDGDRLDELARASNNNKVKKILHIWALLAREPFMHEELSQQTIFDLKFLSVKKSLHGEGLARELTKHSLSLGRDLSYKYARMDATDEFSKRIARDFKMEQLWEVQYRNIINEDERTPVTVPDFPNTRAAVFGLNLREAEIALRPWKFLICFSHVNPKSDILINKYVELRWNFAFFPQTVYQQINFRTTKLHYLLPHPAPNNLIQMGKTRMTIYGWKPSFVVNKMP